MLGFVVAMTAIIVVPRRVFGTLDDHGFGWAIKRVDGGIILLGVGHFYAPAALMSVLINLTRTNLLAGSILGSMQCGVMRP